MHFYGLDNKRIAVGNALKIAPKVFDWHIDVEVKIPALRVGSTAAAPAVAIERLHTALH